MKFLIPLLFITLLLSGCSTLTIVYDYDHQEDFTSYTTYKWIDSDPDHDALENHALLRAKLKIVSDSILASRNFKLIKDTTVETDFTIVVFGILKADTSVVTTSSASYGAGVGFGYGGYGYGGYGYGGYSGYGYGGFGGGGSYNASGSFAENGGYGGFGPTGMGAYPTSVGVGVGTGSGSDSRTYLEVQKEGSLIFDVVNPKTKSLVWRSIAAKTVQEYNSAQQADDMVRKIVRKVWDNFPPPTK